MAREPNKSPQGSLGDFDQYAKSYDATVNDAIGLPGLKVDFFTAAKVDYIEAFLATRFPGRTMIDILDVGCGVGNYHPHLVKPGRKLSGIDVSADSIAMAQAHNAGVSYAVFDGWTIPHGEAAFDYAFAVCVLHHVPPPQRLALINDIRRVLKPGGWFAIFEHNPLNPLTMRVVNRCPFDADAILLKRQESEALLTDAGFRNVETRFILTAPLRGGVGRAVDGMFSRLPLGAQYMTTGVA
jgi:SAM-dependent methyltransferase